MGKRTERKAKPFSLNDRYSELTEAMSSGFKLRQRGW
jgi:hypothetical protein